jgi:hypothetical protein
MFFQLGIKSCDSKDWSNLWLETDSTLVVQAFNDTSLVPWRLWNRWFNCFILIKSVNIIVSPIYREGNTCPEDLANIGLSLDMFTFWYDMPDIIRIGLFQIDRVDLTIGLSTFKEVLV